MRRGKLLRELEQSGLSEQLVPVYGSDAPSAAYRLRELVLEYVETFPCDDEAETLLFSTPGRTELGGNHTDHQHGHGLAASVDLDTIACVVPNNSQIIRIKSRHHRMAEVDLGDLSIRKEEAGNSVSLVRGVASRLTQLGYTVGGFDAYTTTRVLRGSGLSSSAAFEVLVATIMNQLFCGGALTSTDLAKVGQYAENVYFGKPCGLMDQLSCATGGVIAIDFKDPDDPQLQQVQVDLRAFGHALCIIDTRASHADLTADYAAITQEMREVAACFGREVLGDVSFDRFRENLATVRATCGDRAAMRAYHSSRMTSVSSSSATRWSRGTLTSFSTWSASPAAPPSCICKTYPTTGRAAVSRWPCFWPWPRICWQAEEPAGSTAAALPVPSRPLFPWTCSLRLSPAWRQWRARGPAMFCPSGAPALSLWSADPTF